MTRGRGVRVPSPAEPLRTTVVACAVLATLGAAAGLVGGRPGAGGAFAVGTLLGCGNGFLARSQLGQATGAGSQVVTTTLARLAALSLAAIGLGLLFGPGLVPLVVAGVAAAQVALATSAAVRGVREVRRAREAPR
jgi:hypothetical protein